MCANCLVYGKCKTLFLVHYNKWQFKTRMVFPPLYLTKWNTIYSIACSFICSFLYKCMVCWRWIILYVGIYEKNGYEIIHLSLRKLWNATNSQRLYTVDCVLCWLYIYTWIRCVRTHTHTRSHTLTHQPIPFDDWWTVFTEHIVWSVLCTSTCQASNINPVLKCTMLRDISTSTYTT